MLKVIGIVIYLIGALFCWLLVSAYKFIDNPDNDKETGC